MESTALTVPVSADAEKVLTPEQHAALFGPARVDGTLPATVSAAAAGLGLLAARHLARRLVGDDSAELTAKDRIAMAIVPKIVAEVKRNVSRRVGDAVPTKGNDPIAELLGPSEPAGVGLVTDQTSVKIET